MASKIRVVIAILIAGLPPVLFAQEPTASMRFEAQEIHLQQMVSLEFGSPREAFANVLNSVERAGGMVIVSGCGGADRGPLHATGRSSLATALDLLTATYPEYYWTMQDRAINLLPRRNRPAVMDVRIHRSEWDTTEAVQLNIQRVFDFSGIRSFLGKQGITAGLEQGPGLQRPPRVINGVSEPPPKGRKYELENVTLLSALNAVAASYGKAFWWYEERTCDGKTTYTYSVR